MCVGRRREHGGGDEFLLEVSFIHSVCCLFVRRPVVVVVALLHTLACLLSESQSAPLLFVRVAILLSSLLLSSLPHSLVIHSF